MCIILLLSSVHITSGSFFYFPPHKSKVEGQHESHMLTPAQSGKLTLWPSESNNRNKNTKQSKIIIMIPVVGVNKRYVLLRYQKRYTSLPENLKFA